MPAASGSAPAGTPMRLISHSSVTPVGGVARGGALPRPGPRYRRPWRSPVLIRKLQCFSLTPARRRASGRGSRRRRSVPTPSCPSADCGRSSRRCARGPAASPRGWRGSPPCAPRSRRRRRARARKPRAHHDRARRQVGVAVGERRASRPSSRTISPERVTISAQSRTVRDVAAIGAGVHRHRAADACRECRDRNSSPASPAAAACSATVTSSAAAPATTPSASTAIASKPRAEADRHAGQPAVAHDQVGARRRSRAPARRAAARAGTRADRRRRPDAPAPRPGRRRGTR